MEYCFDVGGVDGGDDEEREIAAARGHICFGNQQRIDNEIELRKMETALAKVTQYLKKLELDIQRLEIDQTLVHAQFQIKLQEIAALQQQREERKESNNQEIAALHQHQQWEEQKEKEIVLKKQRQATVMKKMDQAIQRKDQLIAVVEQQKLQEELQLEKKRKDQKLAKAVENLEPEVVTKANETMASNIIRKQEEELVATKTKHQNEKLKCDNERRDQIIKKLEHEKQRRRDIEEKEIIAAMTTSSKKKEKSNARTASFSNMTPEEKKIKDQRLAKAVENLEPEAVTGALKEVEDTVIEQLYDIDNTDLPGYPNNLIECESISFIPMLPMALLLDEGDDDGHNGQLLFHTDDQKKKLGLWIDEDEYQDNTCENVLVELIILATVTARVMDLKKERLK